MVCNIDGAFAGCVPSDRGKLFRGNRMIYQCFDSKSSSLPRIWQTAQKFARPPKASFIVCNEHARSYLQTNEIRSWYGSLSLAQGCISTDWVFDSIQCCNQIPPEARYLCRDTIRTCSLNCSACRFDGYPKIDGFLSIVIIENFNQN